jgi:hypothetical protein
MALGGAGVSRTVWLRLMAMSGCAALVAVIARARGRKAMEPRIDALSAWAHRVEPRGTVAPRPVPNGSRPESAPAVPALPAAEAPAPPRRSHSDAAHAELAQSVARKPAAADRELRQLLRLPEMTLTPPTDVQSPRRSRSRLRVVSSELLAGLRQLHAESYSVYVMAASLVALIALGAMYLTISGGGNDPRSFTATGPPPASDAPSGGVSGAESASVADQMLDARRELDLAQLRDALTSYAAFFGKYPATGGAFTTVCVRWTDPACEVIAHGRNLPVSDGSLPYWYASDGTSFTLMARMQAWPEVDSCPDVLPPEVGEGPVGCIAGAISQP